MFHYPIIKLGEMIVASLTHTDFPSFEAQCKRVWACMFEVFYQPRGVVVAKIEADRWVALVLTVYGRNTIWEHLTFDFLNGSCTILPYPSPHMSLCFPGTTSNYVSL